MCGSWGEGKQEHTGDTLPVVPRAPPIFQFLRFFAISPLKEPLQKRENGVPREEFSCWANLIVQLSAVSSFSIQAEFKSLEDLRGGLF